MPFRETVYLADCINISSNVKQRLEILSLVLVELSVSKKLPLSLFHYESHATEEGSNFCLLLKFDNHTLAIYSNLAPG